MKTVIDWYRCDGSPRRTPDLGEVNVRLNATDFVKWNGTCIGLTEALRFSNSVEEGP